MQRIFSLAVALGCIFTSYGQSLVPGFLLQQATTLIAQDSRLHNRTVACLVDFSKPSYEKRLWIVNLTNGECLLHTWVAHGRGTGRTAEAKVFSNQAGTYCSSLGLFLPKEQFNGKHGLSLRLAGLEPGVNDKAEVRGIIFHAAPYVNPHNAAMNKRQGNSQGCFVVPEPDIKKVVQLLENPNAFIWATQVEKPLLSAQE